MMGWVYTVYSVGDVVQGDVFGLAFAVMALGGVSGIPLSFGRLDDQ
jgi:hypothetical protein